MNWLKDEVLHVLDKAPQKCIYDPSVLCLQPPRCFAYKSVNFLASRSCNQWQQNYIKDSKKVEVKQKLSSSSSILPVSIFYKPYLQKIHFLTSQLCPYFSSPTNHNLIPDHTLKACLPGKVVMRKNLVDTVLKIIARQISIRKRGSTSSAVVVSAAAATVKALTQCFLTSMQD